MTTQEEEKEEWDGDYIPYTWELGDYPDFDFPPQMDEQEQHDYRMMQAAADRESNPERKPNPKSRKKLEALLEKKKEPAKQPSQKEQLGPIESALKNHHGLTEEKALKIAEAFGF